MSYVNAPQALGLAYLLQTLASVEPFAELSSQDIRCDEEHVLVEVRSNRREPEFDEWKLEVFVDERGGLWRWEQDPDTPFDPNDSTSWLEGWLVPSGIAQVTKDTV